jgi:hypothetical protein
VIHYREAGAFGLTYNQGLERKPGRAADLRVVKIRRIRREATNSRIEDMKYLSSIKINYGLHAFDGRALGVDLPTGIIRDGPPITVGPRAWRGVVAARPDSEVDIVEIRDPAPADGGLPRGILPDDGHYLRKLRVSLKGLPIPNGADFPNGSRRQIQVNLATALTRVINDDRNRPALARDKLIFGRFV